MIEQHVGTELRKHMAAGWSEAADGHARPGTAAGVTGSRETTDEAYARDYGEHVVFHVEYAKVKVI